MSSDWFDHDMTEPPSTMMTASFNQDGGCLAIGTQTGFEIFNLSPFQSSVCRKLGKSLGKIEMLFRCNLIALVGGGDNPYAPAHRVLVWDDHVQKAIGELSFRQLVLSVKLRRDAIAVALRDRVYVYHLSDLSLRDKIYTTDNMHGLLSLSTAVQDMVLACPSVTDGHVRVELYGSRKTSLIEAHESKLRAIALTEDGALLATASIKGTVVRVFTVATSALLAEFRRGVERVHMTCLTWSWDHLHLACCSDKGTTHVFSVGVAGEEAHSSWYDMVRKSLKGNDLKNSISQVRGVPHPLACAFVPDLPHTVAVVGWDVDGNGVVLLSDYSKEEAVRTAYHVICKSAHVDEFALSEGQRRRRRLMGATPPGSAPADDNEGKLLVGERVEVLENQMKEIRFEEQEEGFLNVNMSAETNSNGNRQREEQSKKDEQKQEETSIDNPKQEEREEDLGEENEDQFQDSPEDVAETQ